MVRAPVFWKISLKSMMMSTRSATLSRTLWTWMGSVKKLPSVVVIGPVRDLLGQATGVGQEELVEPGGAGVQQAEAVATTLDVHERLELAVDEELVADEAVQPERVEAELAVRGEQLVGEDQREIELRVTSTRGIIREAGEPESGRLVAGVEGVEQELHPGEALVDVLGRVVDPVVVVPRRRQGFFDVPEFPRG